jgi:hypothetical protein
VVLWAVVLCPVVLWAVVLCPVVLSRELAWVVPV